MAKSKSLKNCKGEACPVNNFSQKLDTNKPLAHSGSLVNPSELRKHEGVMKMVHDLRVTIGLLFLLNQYPTKACPDIKASRVDDNTERLLSPSDEERLTESFCFLASVTKNPRKVAALCLEERNASITIRIAANHGNLSAETKGLQNVIALLREVGSTDVPLTAVSRQCLLDQMLGIAVEMNQNRILCRMRSVHAKWDSNFRKWKAKQAPLLPTLLEKIRNALAKRDLFVLPKPIEQLEELLKALEEMASADARSTPGVTLLVKILKALNQLCASEPLWNNILVDSKGSVQKLVNYVLVSQFLFTQAARNRVLTSMTVDTVRLQPLPPSNTLPSAEDLSLLLSHGAALNEHDLRALNDRATAILNRLGHMTADKYPVHAEIQLWFYYQFFSEATPPRVIRSTKKACFLCHLFFSQQEQFDVPPSHGRLYEKWTLPNHLHNMRECELELFSAKMARFQDALLERVMNAINSGSTRSAGPSISSESLTLNLPSRSWNLLAESKRSPAGTASASASTSMASCNATTVSASNPKGTKSRADSYVPDRSCRYLNGTGPLPFDITALTQLHRVEKKGIDLIFSLEDPQIFTSRWTVSVLPSEAGIDGIGSEMNQSFSKNPAVDVEALYPGQEVELACRSNGEKGSWLTFNIQGPSGISVIHCVYDCTHSSHGTTS